jgi:hypothetical protein
VNLKLYDAGGRLVHQNRQTTRSDEEREVMTENMAKGIYFLELGTETGRLRTKLVVE